MSASVWENASRRISEASRREKTLSLFNESDNILAIISGKSLKNNYRKLVMFADEEQWPWWKNKMCT